MMLDVSEDASQTWTAYYWKPIELVVFLLSLMLLVSLITRRAPSSFQEAKRLGSCNWAILVTLCNSLIFVFTCTLLLFGVGTAKSSGVSFTFPGPIESA